jgi:hypothetical protein
MFKKVSMTDQLNGVVGTGAGAGAGAGVRPLGQPGFNVVKLLFSSLTAGK